MSSSKDYLIVWWVGSFSPTDITIVNQNRHTPPYMDTGLWLEPWGEVEPDAVRTDPFLKWTTWSDPLSNRFFYKEKLRFLAILMHNVVSQTHS